MFVEKLLQQDGGRGGVQVTGAISMGLGGGIALVHLVHGQLEAALQLAGKSASPQGIFVLGAVGMEGHAHHQGIGAKRASPSAAMVRKGWAWRSKVLPLATPTRLRP